MPSIDNITSQLRVGLADVVDFLPVDSKDAAVAIAIGGDGTLISHGRELSKRGIPLIGVNSGRLGFLAKFDAQSLIDHKESVFCNNKMQTLSVMLLEVRVDKQPAITAMNEIMITAGNPFRIIELGLSINDIPAPTLRGDGILVSTPIGSTAHNASVGGPIVDPSAQAFVLTPVAAHSLAVRPIVLDAHNTVMVELLQINEGTALVVDGTVNCMLTKGMKISVQRSSEELSIVLNPSVTYWNTLVDKLHWSAPPG